VLLPDRALLLDLLGQRWHQDGLGRSGGRAPCGDSRRERDRADSASNASIHLISL
jgi:hypothetical protein